LRIVPTRASENERNKAAPHSRAVENRKFGKGCKDGCSSGLRLIEIIVKDIGQFCAVFLPMFSGGVILETGNPIAVEFVDGRIDAETLEPAFTQSSSVTEAFLGGAFGEPGMLAQELLEDFHSFDMLAELRNGRAADVQETIAVIVQFEGQVRTATGLDHVLQPFLQREILG